MDDAEGEGDDSLLAASLLDANMEIEGTKNASVSLPPRKRHLIGLKHNGTGHNNSSSAPGSGISAGVLPSLSPSRICPEGLVVFLSEGALLEAMENSEACVRCGDREGGAAWRRVKDGGIHQYLCRACTLLYMGCPHCLVVFQENAGSGGGAGKIETLVEDWIACCSCRRSVHARCETEANPASLPLEPATFVCCECRRGEEEPSGKKLRASDLIQGHQEQELERSPEDVLAAARDAAAQALKAAVTAKAAAAAKAQAAVKAAMLARNALNNAALAAKEDFLIAKSLGEAPDPEEERGIEAPVCPPLLPPDPTTTTEKAKTAEEIDEEFARQLHRAMNSSTRNAQRKI